MKSASYLLVFVVVLLCSSLPVSAAGRGMAEDHAVQVTQPVQDAVTEGVQETVEVLLRQGIPLDTNAARRAAIQAIAATWDAGSRLFSAEGGGSAGEGEVGVSNAPARTSVELLEKWPGEICYAKFHGLHGGTGPESARAIRDATNGGITGVILDLRGAGGDGLDCVEAIAGLFIEGDREITSVSGPDGVEVERRRLGNGSRLGVPAIFLIDGGTSGSAELLAAVVKNGSEVLLVGRPTLGDTLIRESVALKNGETLYIGTKRAIPIAATRGTPAGVVPDILVKETIHTAPRAMNNPQPGAAVSQTGTKEEDERAALAARFRDDAILLRAIDILMGLRTLDTKALEL